MMCILCCSVRPEVEKKGLLSSKESCWSYYVQKCRNNLHVVLAMSPVGETLRTRCRNFPGMVNNTVIDWFEPWPEQALQSVASVFLAEEQLPEKLRPQIVEHMVTVHQSVRTFSARFLEELRRWVTGTGYAISVGCIWWLGMVHRLLKGVEILLLDVGGLLH